MKRLHKPQSIVWIFLGLSMLIAALYLFPFGGHVAQYLLRVRSRKLLAYLLVAVIASFSTISFQTIIGNRFLTPSVLGLENFYVLLQSLFLFFYWNWGRLDEPNSVVEFVVVMGLQMLFFAALLPMIRQLLTRGFGTILLICMGIGTLLRSSATYLQVIMDPNEYDKLQGRLFASLQHVNTDVLMIACFITIVTVYFLYRKSLLLNVLYLGKSNAILLGVQVEKLQIQVLWAVVLLTSVSTAMVGPMSFFGFMVVNLLYHWFRYYEHRWLFLMGSLVGFIILVGAQMVLERVLNYQWTLSMLVELGGGFLFFYLLYKERIK